MKISIFIHGVPNGQKVWSMDGTDAVVANYYGQGQGEETKFVAEIKKSNGTPYAYYSYLRYNNVFACDGRAGSYVGLTVRMDAMCTDVVSIYNILDIVYYKYVVGKIVSSEGGKTKFFSSEFSDSDCKPLETSIVTLLQNALHPKSFVEITDQMVKGNGAAAKLNNLDCDRSYVASLMRQGARITISPQYDTSRESRIHQDYQQMLVVSGSEKEKQIQQQQRDINELRAQISKMQAELNSCRKQIHQYEQESIKLRKENALLIEEKGRNPQVEAKKRMEELGRKIDSLSGKVDGIKQGLSSDAPVKLSLADRIIPIACSVIVIATVAIFGALQYFPTKNSSDSGDVDSVNEESGVALPKDSSQIAENDSLGNEFKDINDYSESNEGEGDVYVKDNDDRSDLGNEKKGLLKGSSTDSPTPHDNNQ